MLLEHLTYSYTCTIEESSASTLRSTSTLYTLLSEYTRVLCCGTLILILTQIFVALESPESRARADSSRDLFAISALAYDSDASRAILCALLLCSALLCCVAQ